jgi:hypothetical protein
MATNFFQQQDSARRKTFQLVVYFVLAILILIALDDRFHETGSHGTCG